MSAANEWLQHVVDPSVKIVDLLKLITDLDACEEVAFSEVVQNHKQNVIYALKDVIIKWREHGALVICVGMSIMLLLKDFTSWPDAQVVRALTENVWEQKGNEAHLPAVELLYEVCNANAFRSNEIEMFDEFFVAYLFDLVEQTRDFVDDSLTLAITKLLLAINEQLQEHKNEGVTNWVVVIASKRIGMAKTFTENFALLFNRGGDQLETGPDTVLKTIMLNFLFLLFQKRENANFFFTNDFKVIIDTFIRELHDLPIEAEQLKQSYLIALYHLLQNSSYRKIGHKKEELRNTLDEIYTNELADETTREQAGNILIECAEIFE